MKRLAKVSFVWFFQFFAQFFIPRKEGYACAIGCIDGRCFEAVIRYCRKKYRVQWVDFRTMAGVNAVLSSGSDTCAIDDIMRDVIVSKRNHKSKVIVIVGHSRCAGNPTERQQQEKHLRQAKKIVEFHEIDVPTELLWVDVDRQTCEAISAHNTDETSSVKVIVE